VFRIQFSGHSSAWWASNCVAHMLTKESKPFSDVKFIQKYFQHILQEICSEKEMVFNIISLFHVTMFK
jgi:hypothetical protein